MFKIKHGFTLAEMMVVMLILSIIMAAMAPVMTTRNKLDQSSPWQWAENGSDAYFGLGNAMIAMIGQPRAGENDTDARLLINAGDDKKHILFKTGDTVQGFLQFANNTLAITNSNTQMGENSVVIGTNSTSSGSEGVAIGYNAHTSGNDSTAIGQNSGAGKNSVALGSGALALETNTSEMNNVAIGYQTMYNNNGASENTAVGYRALHAITSGSDNVAIGTNALGEISNGGNNIAIGTSAMASADSTTYNTLNLPYASSGNIAIGREALAHEGVLNNPSDSIGIGAFTAIDGTNSIAIGFATSTATTHQRISGATAVGNSSIALGTNVYAYNMSTAIGYDATAGYDESGNLYSGNAIAIGRRANAFDGVAIGYLADASPQGGTAGGSVALGRSAQAWGSSSIVIGSGRASGANSLSIAGGIAGGKYSIAIGYNAEGYEDDNIAIGRNACKNTRGSNKICIGANSGPQESSHPWARILDRTERIFIGGPSANGGQTGVATLSIHNSPTRSVVLIEGDLVVNGQMLIKEHHMTAVILLEKMVLKACLQ